MTQTGLNIRMDNDLKRDFGSFCNEVGMTMSTAFVVFAKTVVRERRFPFEITTLSLSRKSRREEENPMLELFEKMRQKTRSSGRDEMTLEEINAEIADVRRERRMKTQRSSH